MAWWQWQATAVKRQAQAYLAITAAVNGNGVTAYQQRGSLPPLSYPNSSMARMAGKKKLCLTHLIHHMSCVFLRALLSSLMSVRQANSASVASVRRRGEEKKEGRKEEEGRGKYLFGLAFSSCVWQLSHSQLSCLSFILISSSCLVSEEKPLLFLYLLEASSLRDREGWKGANWNSLPLIFLKKRRRRRACGICLSPHHLSVLPLILSFASLYVAAILPCLLVLISNVREGRRRKKPSFYMYEEKEGRKEKKKKGKLMLSL